VDGRGNVQLLRDPNNSGGTAVVRIEDSKGGREGYTFDLEWRGGTYAGNSSDPYYDRRNRRNDPYYSSTDPNYRNDPYYQNDRYSSRNRGAYNPDAREAAGMCQDEVRARARRDYGVRNPYFLATDVDDVRSNRDRVVGSFEGNRGEFFDYTCTVNTNNGNIRSVDIRRR
jgi:hypothetical protein